jgi:hypothetical protein
MTTDTLTACTCGSTSFEVSERLWHPAVIEAGQLVITDTDGSMDGFHLALCQSCGHEYDLAAFDIERLLDHYGA